MLGHSFWGFYASLLSAMCLLQAHLRAPISVSVECPLSFIPTVRFELDITGYSLEAKVGKQSEAGMK